MYNIWGFLLQTMSVSIVLGIILLLKRIFEDKLSPKWQYGIWTLLAIRILIPVNLGKYIIPQLALWIEVLKSGVEDGLASIYTSVYEPITLYHVVPVLSTAPQSVTDWLFALYFVGVILFLLKYFISYIRLRALLSHSIQTSQEIEEKMATVCTTYHLKGCKIVTVKGLTSAFICGVFRPVLVVPTESDIDEKVILHELLHLKYYDTIQNIIWCILRSLHWCNPLIFMAINCIENDMESMCDQRVLELLEGEERREYGHILLSMANQKYARIPGTTSISNGGKNISKRIAAIVRFKKYPQGMALVSVCIILTMFWPTIIGTAATYNELDYIYYADTFDKSMPIARINRCSTVAGALDMYAKGLYELNGAYIATASPLENHEKIAEDLKTYGCYQPGEYIRELSELYDFYVYNLKQETSTEYSATICYWGSILEDMDYRDIYILIPVKITKEYGWIVEETGERYVVPVGELANEIICPIKYYGKNDVGEIELNIQTKYEINHIKGDMSPNLDAKLNRYVTSEQLTYTHLLDEIPYSYVSIRLMEKEYSNPVLELSRSTDDWTGSISGGGGGGSSLEGDVEEIIDLPNRYFVNLNIGGTEMENIILEEVKD